jgi:hypothetical protein
MGPFSGGPPSRIARWRSKLVFYSSAAPNLSSAQLAAV